MKLMHAALPFNKDVATCQHPSGVTQTPLVIEQTLEDASLTGAFTSNEGLNGDGEEMDD